MRRKIPVLLFLLFLLFSFPAAAADDEGRTLEDARTLIGAKAFSRKELITQLEEMGHPRSAAEQAADEIGADWNEMALKQAGSFLSYMPFSESELKNQLLKAGFTAEETEYAVRNCGADWKENALKHAESYLEMMEFTRTELMQQLLHDGFTYERSLYAVTQTLGAPEQSELADLSNPTRISQEMRDFLTENIENIFPIQSLKETYSSVVQPVYTDLGPGTAVQMRTREGQQTIRIYANADGVHSYTFTDGINSGNLRNFMFSMDVSINDVYPTDEGGCFIGYTNGSVTAVKNDDPSLTALVLTPEAAEFFTKNETAESGSRTRISENNKSVRRLTLIRITGLTFAYIDGEYAGQFYDSNEGPFQLVFGSVLYKNGDASACSFDNMAVRKVN